MSTQDLNKSTYSGLADDHPLLLVPGNDPCKAPQQQAKGNVSPVISHNTTGLSTSDDSIAMTTQPQRRLSYLLDLPAELRLIIYRHYYYGFHPVLWDGGCSGAKVQVQDAPPQDLELTCRVLHAEARHYRRTTFSSYLYVVDESLDNRALEQLQTLWSFADFRNNLVTLCIFRGCEKHDSFNWAQLCECCPRLQFLDIHVLYVDELEVWEMQDDDPLEIVNEFLDGYFDDQMEAFDDEDSRQYASSILCERHNWDCAFSRKSAYRLVDEDYDTKVLMRLDLLVLPLETIIIARECELMASRTRIRIRQANEEEIPTAENVETQKRLPMQRSTDPFSGAWELPSELVSA